MAWPGPLSGSRGSGACYERHAAQREHQAGCVEHDVVPGASTNVWPHCCREQRSSGSAGKTAQGGRPSPTAGEPVVLPALLKIAIRTPPPTDTARPTNTPRPVIPTATFTPAPPPPTATPAQEFTGAEMPLLPESYRCSGFQGIVVRVVDRAGKPLPGYLVHIGQDGTHFSAWTNPTTGVTKDPYGYNADFSVGPSKFYVAVFRSKVDPYDVGQAISNEVTVYVEPDDTDACSQTEGKNNGNKVRIAPVQFIYNR